MMKMLKNALFEEKEADSIEASLEDPLAPTEPVPKPQRIRTDDLCVESEESNGHGTRKYKSYMMSDNWLLDEEQIMDLESPIEEKMQRQDHPGEKLRSDRRFWKCLQLKLLHTFTLDPASVELPPHIHWKLPPDAVHKLPSQWLVQEIVVNKYIHLEEPTPLDKSPVQHVNIGNLLRTVKIDSEFEFLLKASNVSKRQPGGVAFTIPAHDPQANFFFNVFPDRETVIDKHLLLDSLTGDLLCQGQYVFVKKTLSWEWFVGNTVKMLVSSNQHLYEFAYCCLQDAFRRSTLSEEQKLAQIRLQLVQDTPILRVEMSEERAYGEEHLNLLGQYSVQHIYKDNFPHYHADTVRMRTTHFAFFLWILETQVLDPVRANTEPPSDFQVWLEPFPPLTETRPTTHERVEIDMEIYYLEAVCPDRVHS